MRDGEARAKKRRALVLRFDACGAEVDGLELEHGPTARPNGDASWRIVVGLGRASARAK